MNTVENIIPIRGNQQMNNQLPEPPVTADCDLRTFRYMPFDVARFRDSRFSAVIDPAAGFFAIQLWAAAWHQVPAGSLPNEDAMLRMLSGCGRDQRLWDSVKDGALYGFVPHADGRLYHPAITEFVIEAYGKLLKNTENGKKGGRPPKPNANPTLTDGKPNANPTLTQHEPSEVKGSEVKGSEDKDTPKPPQADSEPEAGNAAKAASVSVQQVVDLYHEILPSLPSVLKVTDARRKAISARIHDDLKTPSEWRVFFSRVGKSDFLTGKADNFRADLEWLCKPSNFLKVREGRYDPKNATSATTERSSGTNNPPPPRYLN